MHPLQVIMRFKTLLVIESPTRCGPDRIVPVPSRRRAHVFRLFDRSIRKRTSRHASRHRRPIRTHMRGCRRRRKAPTTKHRRRRRRWRERARLKHTVTKHGTAETAAKRKRRRLRRAACAKEWIRRIERPAKHGRSSRASRREMCEIIPKYARKHLKRIPKSRVRVRRRRRARSSRAHRSIIPLPSPVFITNHLIRPRDAFKRFLTRLAVACWVLIGMVTHGKCAIGATNGLLRSFVWLHAENSVRAARTVVVGGGIASMHGARARVCYARTADGVARANATLCAKE